LGLVIRVKDSRRQNPNTRIGKLVPRLKILVCKLGLGGTICLISFFVAWHSLQRRWSSSFIACHLSCSHLSIFLEISAYKEKCPLHVKINLELVIIFCPFFVILLFSKFSLSYWIGLASQSLKFLISTSIQWTSLSNSKNTSKLLYHPFKVKNKKKWLLKKNVFHHFCLKFVLTNKIYNWRLKLAQIDLFGLKM